MFKHQNESEGLDPMGRRVALLLFIAVSQLHGLAAIAQSAEQGAAVSPAKSAPQAAPLGEQQRAWLKAAHRHDKHGWVYLHIEGGPHERGFQHGYLLAKEIRESLHAAKVKWEYESGMDWPWLVKKSAEMFLPKVDPENLAEIDGIAAGLGAAGVPSTREELVAFNGIIELASYWWPKEKDKLGAKSPNPPRQACSALIATGSMTADGRIVLGHNTMCSYADAIWYVILDVQPAQGHRILMQAAPAWIHSGTDFFVTDAGLVGAETTIGGFKSFDKKGVPEFVRMRRATQDADSIDQWCAIMKNGNNGGYANAWLLGDIKTNEIARLELGLKHVGFEKKQDGYFVGSNVAEDLKLLRFETNVRETDVRISSVARRVRWKQLMKQYAGKIDLELAKTFEADHYDAYLQKDHPGDRCLCGHEELDPQSFGSQIPFQPGGTIDGKVVDATLAKQMAFAARWGAACGRAFDAREFLEAHPQFDWMREILESRPSQPWTVFRAGEKP
jgi:hypothetical protein